MKINHYKNAEKAKAKNLSHPSCLLFVVSLVFSAVAWSQTGQISPDMFSYKTQIDFSAHGEPFYQITMPIQVYQGAQQPNLADLRVFNRQGEPVSYAWLRTSDTRASQEKKSIAVSVFPIRQSTTDHHDNAEMALEFKRKTDGSLIAVNKHKKKTRKEITILRGAVLDLSQIQDNISGLRIETSGTTSPFHAFDLEISDDLQQWHSLLTNAQLVHL